MNTKSRFRSSYTISSPLDSRFPWKGARFLDAMASISPLPSYYLLNLFYKSFAVVSQIDSLVSLHVKCMSVVLFTLFFWPAIYLSHVSTPLIIISASRLKSGCISHLRTPPELVGSQPQCFVRIVLALLLIFLLVCLFSLQLIKT